MPRGAKHAAAAAVELGFEPDSSEESESAAQGAETNTCASAPNHTQPNPLGPHPLVFISKTQSRLARIMYLVSEFQLLIPRLVLYR